MSYLSLPFTSLLDFGRAKARPFFYPCARLSDCGVISGPALIFSARLQPRSLRGFGPFGDA